MHLQDFPGEITFIILKFLWVYRIFGKRRNGDSRPYTCTMFVVVHGARVSNIERESRFI